MVQAPVKRELGTAVAGKVSIELADASFLLLSLWQWPVDITHQ